MKRLIIYIYSGAYYFWIMQREIGLRTIVPVIGKFFNFVFDLCPPVKRNLGRRGLTVEQYVDNTTKFIKRMQRNDIGGALRRHFENTLTCILFVFFMDVLILTSRLLNITVFDKYINTGIIIVLVPWLLAFLSIKKMEKLVLSGKSLKFLESKPKDFRNRALVVFLVFCFCVFFVLLKH